MLRLEREVATVNNPATVEGAIPCEGRVIRSSTIPNVEDGAADGVQRQSTEAKGVNRQRV